MVGQDVGQAFEGEKVIGGDAEFSHQCGDRVIGRSKHGEGAFSGKRIDETGSATSSLKQGVVLAVHDDVHDRSGLGCWWHQNSIDDVHHTVVGGDVSHGYRSVVDHDRSVHDGDGNVGTVECGEHVAVHEVGAEGRCAHHVVGQDVGKVLQGEQIVSRDAQLSDKCRDGVVGGSKKCKRTVTGKRTSEVGLDDSGFEQCVVFAVDHHVDHGGLG